MAQSPPSSTNHFQPTDGQNQLLRAIGLLDPFYAAAVEAVEYAAEAINENVAQRGFRAIQNTSESKGDGSPVSSADIASHDALKKYLRECSPFPIVSEEEAGGVPSLSTILEQTKEHPFFWLADPLDGTRDFLAGEKTFAVALALMHVGKNVDGTPLVTPYFGCISDPTARTTWWGSRDTQLTKRVDGEDVELPTAPDGEAGTNRKLRVLGSRSIPSERMQALYDFWNVTEITRMGSALKFALIAEGSFDVYPRFGPTSEWDTAAGQLLLEISGGCLSSLETGRALHYGKPLWRNQGFLAMGSQKLMDQWLPLIRERMRERTPKS